jgi:acyl carrier protein
VLGVSELRGFLKEKLPDYMVPSAFVLLDTLPLTPNGKVDRQALPAPGGIRPELERGFVAPRTPFEEILAGIWTEILGIEQVSVHDNFFELGGHSLLATQVVSQVRDTFQVELPLRSLFEAATVSDLTTVVEQRLIEQVGAETLTEMWAEMEQLPEDEAEALLAAGETVEEEDSNAPFRASSGSLAV